MTESSGGTDERRRPVTWPTAGAARDVLREWVDGPDDAHLYVSEDWLAARGADLTVMASSVGGRDGQHRFGDTPGRGSRRSRTPLLLIDLVAVLVFAAVRWSGSAKDLVETLVAAAPFLAGAVVGGAAARSWRAPLPWRAGLAT